MRKAALATLALATLAGCAAWDSRPSPVPTPLERVVKVDRLNVPDGVITYITERGSPAYGPSVRDAKELEEPKDVSKLKGAPDDFKAFIVQQMAERAVVVQSELAEKHTDMVTEDCHFTVQFRVWGIAKDVATGRVRGCDLDSFDVIWQKKDGAWRQASRQQGGWDCSELDHYRVPAAITAAVCWYDNGRKTRAYNGPR
ncbi:MAG: hypothetical protein ACJ71Z_00545 [Aeromicrobium sp.]